jgi:hypothetical protein
MNCRRVLDAAASFGGCRVGGAGTELGEAAGDEDLSVRSVGVMTA